jgi:hypothetical protein
MAPPAVERILADQKSLGLFDIDGNHSAANILTSAVLNYLRVLRGQAVIALHQKSPQSGRRRQGGRDQLSR